MTAGLAEPLAARRRAVPALILLHGALGAGSQFESLRRALYERVGDSFAVYAPDLEGHGGSARGERPFRMTHFVENVRELMDRSGIERASIFGYSMGGYVGLCVAAGAPERIERVMTLGTKFRWTPDVAAREGAMLDPRRMEEKVPRFADALRARHAGSGWEDVLARTRDLMQQLGAGPDLADQALASIALPVRIGVGDRDATVTVEESAAIARLLPMGELEVLPRTPHPLEKVDAVRLAGSIAEFLATR